jgi:hypothetical protein
MDEDQQVTYLEDQIRFWMDALGEATTLEDIDLANANLMDYIQQLQGMVDLGSLQGDIFGENPNATWADWLESIMTEASETANRQLDAVEDVVQDAYDDMVARLNEASDALLNFTEALTGEDGEGTGGTGDPTDPDEPRPPVNIQNQMNFSQNIYLDGEPLWNIVQTLVQDSVAQYSPQSPVIE